MTCYSIFVLKTICWKLQKYALEWFISSLNAFVLQFGFICIVLQFYTISLFFWYQFFFSYPPLNKIDPPLIVCVFEYLDLISEQRINVRLLIWLTDCNSPELATFLASQYSLVVNKSIFFTSFTIFLGIE